MAVLLISLEENRSLALLGLFNTAKYIYGKKNGNVNL